MKKRYFYSCKAMTIILLSFLVFNNNARAQQFSTIHWMQGIPQSIYSNPGLTPDANIFIGMPGLSSICFGFEHTGFRIDDLIMKNNDGSFYIDDDNMLAKLGKNNYLGVGYQHEVLAFGFRHRENYFSLNFTEKVDFRFGYPEDLMLLFFKGNDYFRGKEQAADFTGFELNASHYHELGLGFSRQWMDELSAGVRAKILFGMANLNIEEYDFFFNTNPDDYEITLHSYMLINTSQAFFDIQMDEDDIGEFNIDGKDFIVQDYLLNTKNLGFAIDLGGIYEIDERFSVGLSVVDLGFINWKSGVSNLSLNGEFGFEGFDWPGFKDLLDDEETDLGDMLTDTINELYDSRQIANSYRLMLPPKILLSGTYNISDIHKTGLLFRGMFYEGNFFPSFTLAYSIQPIPQIGGSLSYSVIHNNFANIGLGFHFNLYPFQIYFVTDNLIPSLYPHTIQTTTLQLGINWVIDYMYPDAVPLYSP